MITEKLIPRGGMCVSGMPCHVAGSQGSDGFLGRSPALLSPRRLCRCLRERVFANRNMCR